MPEPTCLASQLIEKLQGLIERHGDVPVYAHDPDTDRRLPIGLVYGAADAEEELPERLEITSDYYGRPLGDLL